MHFKAEQHPIDIVLSPLTCSQSVNGVPLEEGPEQGLGLRAEVLWHPQLGLEDLGHRVLAVVALERELSGQHLVLWKKEKSSNYLAESGKRRERHTAPSDKQTLNLV